ncbi:MAG: molecular chaperone [Castellaniella sp.]|uniref:fimbrial biogenesis chaperone n=1 Tax=Castellaniella sp. TaxID=1955812 RepID=UPI003A83521F
MRPLIRLLLPVALAGALTCSISQAAVQLSSTRVIMNEKDRNVSVFARNIESQPIVVQAWIEGPAGEMKTPFFITPPLSRFDGGVERSLNISRVDTDFPPDRESYYWVNILEIPQKAETTANSLALAMRTRIKLFYRPTAIKDAARGGDQLTWQLTHSLAGCEIHIANASPYTVNFAWIETPGGSKSFANGVIAMPLESTRVPLARCPAGGSLEAQPHVVNDYGATESWPAILLKEGQAVTGTVQ